MERRRKVNDIDRIQRTKEAFEDIACEQECERIKKEKLRELGVDVDAVYVIRKLPDFPPIFRDREPRIPVLPYAKFDKYHKKKRK